jgi:hypothetical protein
MEFRHPKYYKELRKRNKETQQELQRILDKPGRSVSNSDQSISSSPGDGQVQRSTGPGLKLPGPRPISNANKGLIHRRQATSNKPQAPSLEKKEPQASSDKQQASSSKPQASSSKI